MMNDGEEERMNPYHWECSIHGSGWGPIDECPKCLEKSMKDDEAHEYDWIPAICGDCTFFDISMKAHCQYYGFWTKSFEGKNRKKCKHKQLANYDPDPDFDVFTHDCYDYPGEF